MRYLVELVKKEKPEIPQDNIEYVISYLYKEGHIIYTVQYHYDIYEFYIKALDHYKTIGLQKKCAFIDTMEHFKIKRSLLFNIIKEFSPKSCGLETT